MTEQEQNWFDYLQNSYPKGLRGKSEDTSSVIRNYDFMRAFTLSMLYTLVKEQSDNLMVETATEMGLAAWETFLRIPILDTEPLDVRRANIRARLSGNAGTIQSMRSIIETFIPTGSSYDLQESWKVSSDPDVVWSYMLTLPSGVISEEQYTNLVSILNNIHPAHCELILNYTTGIYDAISLSDSVAHGIHKPFLWGDESNPLPSDLDWVDDSSGPLVGSVWQ